MRVLITGITGFVGPHLAKALQQCGDQVYGAALTGAVPGVAVHRVDMRSKADLQEVLHATQPEAIVHLAGLSSVRASWQDPATVMDVNAGGTARLLEAMLQQMPEARLVSVGSSEEYGLVDSHPNEESATHPQSPYAVSKAAQGQLVLAYAARHGLNAVHLRPCNQIGPGQGRGFVAPDFASQIAALELRDRPLVVHTGGLQSARQFLDVRDMATLYAIFVRDFTLQGVFNIAHHPPLTVGALLDQLLKLSTLAKHPRIEDAPSFEEMPVAQELDCTRLRRAVNFKPRYTLSQTLAEVLDQWRQLVRE